MRHILSSFFLLSACLWICVGCKDNADVVRDDLAVALNAYVSGDYETYIDCVDFGEDLDSIHALIFRKAYDQYRVSLNRKEKNIISIEPTVVKFINDSVAYAFYAVNYQDGTSEMCSHKMARFPDRWKIVIRN